MGSGRAARNLSPSQEPMSEARQDYPATSRNSEPILAQLRRFMPQTGLVLEVAAGTGQHAVYFCRHLPGLTWQPSDPDPALRASIAAWREHEGLANLLPAVELDATAARWPVVQADAIFCANMIHIAPWTACEGLMRGAGRTLGPGGILFLYGPFHRHGGPTSPSNARFDASLRARDPGWGVRHLEQVQAEARANGMALVEVVAMPANNFCVVFAADPVQS